MVLLWGENPDDSWYLIGSPYRSEVYDAQGRKRSESVTVMNQVDLGINRQFVHASDQVLTVYDTTGAKRSTASRSTYDASNGNVIESIAFGEVNASADGSFVDLLPDNRRSVVEYAENTAEYVLAFPKRTQLFDETNTLMGQMEMILR